ncbi:ABC transporter permease [Bifidobacterium sp. ESL0800]|uniref:ABC transporter permease n=1 Tax=Bifidobacterium sp. ESL0800 TaxID=2983236 RepID=UPI0023F7AD78|nr:ABC transporter permease [Bifidobacterium sp. ESL0800]WEV76338.1 ABC transporter permease [Bifidobacterium sp. ESL0800]
MMKASDIVRLAGQNLKRRKSRTVLTVLGVIVGSCSILIMISLGQGMSAQSEQMLKAMGDMTLISVSSESQGDSSSGQGSSSPNGSGSAPKITKSTVRNFRDIDHVVAATQQVQLEPLVNVSTGSGRYTTDEYSNVVFEGIDMAQLKAMGFQLTAGREPLRSGEVLAGKYTAYAFKDKFRTAGEERRMSPEMGCEYNEATGKCEPSDDQPFFDPLKMSYEASKSSGDDSGADAKTTGMDSAPTSSSNASAPTNRIYKFNAVGSLKRNVAAGNSTDIGFLMDLQDLEKLRKTLDATGEAIPASSSALVKVDSIENVKQVQDELNAEGFGTSSSEDSRKAAQKESNLMQLALGSIGAVAFLVAAIGIANTMIMSVTERTKEIGIMKALGCSVRDIRLMFLAEAASLGILGGLVGCVLSGLASLGINVIAKNAAGPMMIGDGQEASTNLSIIPWWLYVAAVVFCAVIGLIFGFGPANKAVRIPALDAIKNQE